MVRKTPRRTGLGLLVLASLTAVTSAGAARAHLPWGPGPRTHYQVQPQFPSGHCHYRFTASHQPLPDPHCTPGALNPRVTQATIATTICRSGYTAKIRPPESITAPEKRADAISYNYRGSLGVAEYDHLIPLELGGDPNDRRNLWVEPPSPGHNPRSGVYNPKDKIEGEARTLVCAHQVGLVAMQNALAANWTTAIAVVTHTVAPVPRPRGPLTCSARVSNPRPAQYSTVVVKVSTQPNAAVTGVAHYKSKDTVKSTTAGATGYGFLAYAISRATEGYVVVVSITAAQKGIRATCRTTFIPS